LIRFGTSIAGTAGFVFVFGLGMALDRDWGRTTISASIAALTFGFLVHWWMTLWLVSLRSAAEEQARLQAQATQTQEATAQADVELAPEAPIS
jgi:hypothetical protein